MNLKEANLNIDDYLDLYLLAGSLEDQTWQDEMMKKLQNFQNEPVQDPALEIDNLWKEYKKVNIELLDLYHQLRNQASNKELHKKAEVLKKQRMSLSRKIYSEEKKSKHHNS
ncbi:hypothetical protein JMM81_08660 [Bacillus sp. V3B]|uniref:hypothetical protein n=1 Tax=Bacillus sp. V3B TaxID=2804915 RepID=UPI00210F1774|nr:hypothetical protein [Bacillus sp. V3B]MCQ6275031.1 hypothetical protein [Bacillus sp. V3B]